MELEIHTWDKTLLFDILDKSSASIGDAITIPGDAKLTYKGTLICKALGIDSHEVMDLFTLNKKRRYLIYAYNVL